MRNSLRAVFAAVIFSSGLIPVSANAAPNLIEVQGRVRDLQEQAATAAEGAQDAKVQLAKLKRTLDTVQQQASQQGASVDQMHKVIGAIAAEQYKSGPLSQSLELLFSSDPALYLSAVALVKAAEAKFTRQLAIANGKLQEAEDLLAKLTAAERARLAKLNDDQENADQQRSLADAGKYANVGGRGGIAIKYALAQIGDRYVFGAAGLVNWDCSGLTMRAFQAAGVSLPHSSRAQYNYGKSIARKDLQPGDLVFFGKPISHVAIYVGGNRMLHAPRTGARVKIAEFDLGKKPYIGARRL